MYAGSTTLRPRSRLVPAPLRPSVRVTDGCHNIRAATPASFAFSPGWCSMNWTARWRKRRICAHSVVGTMRPVCA